MKSVREEYAELLRLRLQLLEAMLGILQARSETWKKGKKG